MGHLSQTHHDFSEITSLHPGSRLGRIKHFSLFLMAMLVSFIPIFLIDLIPRQGFDWLHAIVNTAIYLVLMGYIILLKVRRLHDFNLNAWWVLLLLVPGVNVIWGMIIFLMPGTKHINRYGPPPEPLIKQDYIILFVLVTIVAAFSASSVGEYESYLERLRFQSRKTLN